MTSQHRIRVGLSTASVYPQNTEAGFRYAAEVGYDGVEVMVWLESVSQEFSALRALSKKYGIPVLSIHAPCLLISQRVWGSDPVSKLDRSAQLASDLGAETVVVHPPFRWQRRYVEGFQEQTWRLERDTGVKLAVENMFPMRADRFFGRRTRSAERMKERGGPGPGLTAFAPSYDPTDIDHPHYTLDLSHTATAGTDAMELAARMGDRLTHIHLADGRGASIDEHLLPGHGTQPCAELCQQLAVQGFTGQVILEISTKHARTAAERSLLLSEALQFARTNLEVGVGPTVGEDGIQKP
ncbi:sugar phosphate isomerase/epimerase [Hoyosella rhizosphaerae]|uniref:sugar phosphate isomerase/epimerase family protein n=1 Tax=Hoyosella rhizosphaerae TaxID=1755582 RepID=UPI0016673799|nr:sugar phosphate isomerase/epimerase [Hoyosella rhizosphaerae]MBN4928388.1 sugar phosphate isomerase/epimerase [Hoyosella rhizosphaerae]